MKKLIFFTIGLLPLLVKGQVNVNIQIPPAGLIQKEQLWNLVLMNNKSDILMVSLKMNLQDAATGEIVLSASTNQLMLGKGIKAITAADVQPIIYNYNTGDFSSRFLPLGSYIACYQVYADGDKSGPLADDCLAFNIDPLSPPLLAAPVDLATLQTPYPQFTWLPPGPANMFSKLSYTMVLSEVLPGQSPTEAVQYNTPLYSRSNIASTYESYLSSMPKLDTGKVYAWQIVAMNGQSYAAKTEVWTFKISGQDKPMIPPSTETYMLLQNDVTGTYVADGDILRVKYFSYDKEEETQVFFLDQIGRVIQQVKQKIHPGINYFDFKVSGRFQQNKIYTVSITDSKRKSYTLTFRIK